jgi:hypothetical protein
MVKMPETVPVLTAKNIHRGGMHGPNDTHCLIGWKTLAFPIAHQYHKATAPLEEACGGWLPSFNDNRRNSKAKVASAWNRAMVKLGYRRRGNRFVWVGKAKTKRKVTRRK